MRLPYNQTEPFLKISRKFCYSGPDKIVWRGNYTFDCDCERTTATGISIILPEPIYTNSEEIDGLEGWERHSHAFKTSPQGDYLTELIIRTKKAHQEHIN